MEAEDVGGWLGNGMGSSVADNGDLIIIGLSLQVAKKAGMRGLRNSARR